MTFWTNFPAGAAEAGFGGPDQYVLDRILRDLTAPATTSDEIEKKLLEAIESGPSESLEPREWAGIRREGKAIVDAFRRAETR